MMSGRREETYELGYDPYDAESILRYAKRLEGRTLREVTGVEELADPRRRRGSFGNAVEEHYFRYDINSDSHPDFDKVGLELKTTPVKRNARGELVAKERLVLTMIDYMNVVDEDFEHSHLLEKASDILLITYLYEPDVSPLDYVIEAVVRWGIPDEDLPQIRHDWETVVAKVRSGHAEDISGSDTLYLEACTKAANSSVRREQPFSDVPAKPRAWALKSSYMTTVQRRLIDDMRRLPRSAGERELSLLELVRARFAPYRGCTEQELADAFGIARSKQRAALITRRILGVAEDDRIEEFEKAGLRPKTMHVRRTGMPKEAVSFPAFDYRRLAVQEFEASEFAEQLQRAYLFVVYREDEQGAYRLDDVHIWQMPDGDVEEARRCYEQMRRNVITGRADVSVGSKENRCCHVRPHGRNRDDTCEQPFGPPVTKKSFWLNQCYVRDELARLSDERVTRDIRA